MTLSGGDTFFKVSEVDNEDGWQEIDISDTSLAASPLDYDDESHERPPVGRLHCYHRGKFFIGGPEEHSAGLAYGTTASTAITFTDADIRAACAGAYFHKDGDAVAYLISSVASTGDSGKLTLSKAYAGATFSSAGYTIYPANPNRVYVSKSLFPESIPTDGWIRVLKGTGDTLKAMMPYGTAMLFLGERSTEILEWETDPTSITDARLSPIPGGRGALCQEVVVEHDGNVYSMDRKGAYRWRGGAPEPISKPVQDVLDSVDFSHPERFHAHFDPINRQYVVFVCYGSETYPQTALVFSVDDGTWSTHF